MDWCSRNTENSIQAGKCFDWLHVTVWTKGCLWLSLKRQSSGYPRKKYRLVEPDLQSALAAAHLAASDTTSFTIKAMIIWTEFSGLSLIPLSQLPKGICLNLNISLKWRFEMLSYLLPVVHFTFKMLTAINWTSWKTSESILYDLSVHLSPSGKKEQYSLLCVLFMFQILAMTFFFPDKAKFHLKMPVSLNLKCFVWNNLCLTNFACTGRGQLKILGSTRSLCQDRQAS